jgi:hypothetical protein
MKSLIPLYLPSSTLITILVSVAWLLHGRLALTECSVSIIEDEELHRNERWT